jgi:hypothetical protein
MQTSRLLTTNQTGIRVWRPLLEPIRKKDGTGLKKSKSEFDITQIESPRHNNLDSANIYSELENVEKFQTKTSFLPPIDTIIKKYNLIDKDSEEKKEKFKSLRKLTRIHLTDTNLASEKSFIERSSIRPSKKSAKIKVRKVKKYRKRNNRSETPPDVVEETLTEVSLPNIKTVYQCQRGLESRMNSFVTENLDRLKRYSKPFCEYNKDHLSHLNNIKKDKNQCMYCMSKSIGPFVPENTFVSNPVPDEDICENKENKSNENEPNMFNDKLNGLKAPERNKKTYFCDILGEKYCLECIECHERRFAKIYETKYMTDSDPFLVSCNLLINQRLNALRDSNSQKQHQKYQSQSI